MSDTPSDYLPLAAEFPAASYEQWRKLAQAALEGARSEDRLRSRTADGLTIEPLYQPARDSSPIGGRPPGARWQVLQRIDHPDPTLARAQAIEDIDGGANGLVLVGAGSIGAHGYGLVPTANAIESVLEAVDLNAGVAIDLDLGPKTNLLAPRLAEYLSRRGAVPQGTNVRFGFDPLGSTAITGVPRDPRELLDDSIAQFAWELMQVGLRRALFCADGRVVHDAGGTEAQELAYVLASGIAMLRALEAGGLPLDDARRMIFFRMTADTDQFLTTAKFRAARLLWQRVETSCGVAPEPVFITAETAWRTMARYEPTVNIVRATIAAFAAGIGGADAIAVLPFTAARGPPDAFARRIARNTQLVLLDEANLARVADPTAGTGWSEDLTLKICRSAWALLQEIESSGGPGAALQTGLIQAKIAAARAERERAVATRRYALVGINEFPDLGEPPIAVLEAKPGELPPMVSVTPIERLVPIRLAEPFEALRETADRLAASGSRPRIFLAALGDPADHAAPVDFAKNFFAAAGIDAAVVDASVASSEDLATAFRASGAKLACLCAGEKVEERTAKNAAKALSEAGVLRLYAVARSGARPSELRAAGVDEFISGDRDMLEILRAAHRLLGL